VKKVKKKKDDANESISVKPVKVKKVKLKKKKMEGNESILVNPEKVVSSSTPILEKENVGQTATPTNSIEDSIQISNSDNIMNSSLTPVKVLGTIKSPKAKGKVEVFPTTRESKSPKASTTPKRPANLKKATDILKKAESNSLFDQKKKSPKKQMDASEEKDKSKKTKVVKKPVEKTKVEADKPVKRKKNKQILEESKDASGSSQTTENVASNIAESVLKSESIATASKKNVKSKGNKKAISSSKKIKDEDKENMAKPKKKTVLKKDSEKSKTKKVLNGKVEKTTKLKKAQTDKIKKVAKKTDNLKKKVLKSQKAEKVSMESISSSPER